MRVAFIGPVGAGKGTRAQCFVRKLRSVEDAGRSIDEVADDVLGRPGFYALDPGVLR